MKVRFRDPDLDRLETEQRPGGQFSQAVVKAFRKRLQFIRNAVDERDLYSMKSLHFEKLEPPRDHQRSMRLNDQWRLILEIEGTTPDKVVTVVGIEDYH